MTSPLPAPPDPFPRADVEQSLATRFETQVARFPTHPALSAEGRVVTYEALDRHANRVANELLERDAGATVALLLEHGPLVPPAALGVLKAARCYVPLPLDHPVERNAMVLSDAQARIILTDEAGEATARALAARMPVPIAVVNVARVDAPSSRPSIPPAQPHDRCFIIYTSGSTGRPKGVVQHHRSILFEAWCYTSLGALGPHDRLSWLQSISTIAGTTALCAALMNGGTLCPFEVRRQGLQELIAWIERERLTVFHTVPTLFRRLAQRLPTGRRFDRLRLVRLGGEAVTASEVALFRDRCPPLSQLVMGLGSSETGNFRTSIFAWDALPADPVLHAGDPVPERWVSLVDPDARPVRPGGVGEIIVSSEFLFEGYWQQPDLTAAVLAPDPDDPRRRRFRTGDLGRIAPDGRLFHVGRSDEQVKIAGQRVEMAEVECVLRGVAPLRDATVVPVAGRDGGLSLVAFVTTAAGSEPAPMPRQLRVQLRTMLPEHMVPRRFELLAELPLLPGGKVDRLALRARPVSPQGAWVAPRNPIEQTVAAIWERALTLRDIGVDDDFLLDLGGDSLDAVQILSDLQDVFDRPLALETFVQARTVAKLSARLTEAAWAPPTDGVLSLHVGGPHPPLFAVCGAFGHALRLLLIAQRLGPEQPFHALQPPGMDWEAAGCRTIEAMAAHSRTVIQRLQPHGPYRLLGTSFGGIVMFEVARQLERAGEAGVLLAMVDTLPPDCALPHGLDRAPRRDWVAGIDVSDRLVAAGVRVARVHRAALDRYVLADRIDARILYFLCRDAVVPATGDRRLLWGEFARGGLAVVPVPGIHGEFHRDPQCAAVAEGLRAALAGAVVALLDG